MCSRGLFGTLVHDHCTTKHAQDGTTPFSLRHRTVELGEFPGHAAWGASALERSARRREVRRGRGTCFNHLHVHRHE